MTDGEDYDEGENMTINHYVKRLGVKHGGLPER